ncbi:HAD-IA family hydrolase [Streptomyces olivaceoviridis]|uniref:HAD-IA family hydrolase n=1 Tax=Streptomyces olivaceoviridis TaxID=1921 RepID=A0ABW7VN87_STROI|nr:HAD-IA family hydrolase [Streptomyces corchorusii]
MHSQEGDTSRAKPAPRLYREALARLGVAPYEAVAFEDSPSGIRAARTAGVRCVAVPNTMTAQGATPADHDDPGGRRDVRPAGPTLHGRAVRALAQGVADHIVQAVHDERATRAGRYQEGTTAGGDAEFPVDVLAERVAWEYLKAQGRRSPCTPRARGSA